MKPLLLTVAIVAVLLSPARAEEGHDHDSPAVAGGPALPRFSAVSESFELVGVVNGKQLAIYLDRFDDNSPVPDAKLELEVGGKKVPVSVHAPGEYEATLAEELKPGVTPVTVMLEIKGETDLLASEIDLHQDERAEAGGAGWLRYLAWGASAVVAALLAMAVFKKLKSRGTAGGTA